MAQFTDIFEDVTKKGRKIPASEYLKDGKHPIIDQGQNQIAGYTNEEEGLFGDVPAIVFGDHTRVLKYVDTPCFLGADGVKLLKAKISGVDYKYLYYALMGVRIPDTGYNRHFKWMKEASICLPLLNEQHKISATLDKINTLIDQRRQQLETLDTLVKSRFIEMFGDIPKSQYRTIKDVCNIVTDGTHQPPKFVSEGIPFLLVSNIANNEVTYETSKFITEDSYNELIKRTPIEVGDILLSTVGSYGHPAIVKSNKKFCFQRHIAYLKPNTDVVDSVFLYATILSYEVQSKIDNLVLGVAQKTLNLSAIRSIEIPVPPMEQQKRFCQIFEQADKSKFRIRQSLEKLEILKKSLMQQYFE